MGIGCQERVPWAHLFPFRYRRFVFKYFWAVGFFSNFTRYLDAVLKGERPDIPTACIELFPEFAGTHPPQHNSCHSIYFVRNSNFVFSKNSYANVGMTSPRKGQTSAPASKCWIWCRSKGCRVSPIRCPRSIWRLLLRRPSEPRRTSPRSLRCLPHNHRSPTEPPHLYPSPSIGISLSLSLSLWLLLTHSFPSPPPQNIINLDYLAKPIKWHWLRRKTMSQEQPPKCSLSFMEEIVQQRHCCHLQVRNLPYKSEIFI